MVLCVVSVVVVLDTVSDAVAFSELLHPVAIDPTIVATTAKVKM
jgi:hypothetical protein